MIMPKREKVTLGEGLGAKTFEFDVGADGRARHVTSYYGTDRPRYNTGEGGPVPDNAPTLYGPPETVEKAARIAEDRHK
jgi:hypothetical protein